MPIPVRFVVYPNDRDAEGERTFKRLEPARAYARRCRGRPTRGFAGGAVIHGYASNDGYVSRYDVVGTVEGTELDVGLVYVEQVEGMTWHETE